MTTVFCLNGRRSDLFGTNPITKLLGGSVTDGQTVVRVAYDARGAADANLADGAAKFDTLLHSTPGLKIGYGYDLGAAALTYWLANTGPGSDIPDSDLAFVLLGNPARKYGGILNNLNISGFPQTFWERLLWGPWTASPVETPSDTPYTVLDLAREYDGFCDFPDVTAAAGYTVAAENARWGAVDLHSHGYDTVSSSDLDNYGFVEGNVTYMLAPTMPAPYLKRHWYEYFRVAQEQADKAIRPKIDASYSWGRTTPLYTPMVTAPFPDYGTVACADPDHFYMVGGDLTLQPWMQHRQVATASYEASLYNYSTKPGRAFATEDDLNKNETVSRVVCQWVNLSPINHWVYGVITRGGIRVTLTARTRGYLQLNSGMAVGHALPALTESSRVGIGGDQSAGVYCVAEIRQNSRSMPLAPEITGWTLVQPGQEVTAEAEVKFISEFWENTAINGGTVETMSGFSGGELKLDLFAVPVIDPS